MKRIYVLLLVVAALLVYVSMRGSPEDTPITLDEIEKQLSADNLQEAVPCVCGINPRPIRENTRAIIDKYKVSPNYCTVVKEVRETTIVMV